MKNSQIFITIRQSVIGIATYLLVMLFACAVRLDAQVLAAPPPVEVIAPSVPAPTPAENKVGDEQAAKTMNQALITSNAFGDGEVSWQEGAENGLGNVIDDTDASYSLIQSDEVANGSNAFHLANPGFNDNWFMLDVNIDVEAATKLFFQSRLQYATTAQFARVQVSTDGGFTWPATVYSQAGTGGSGEGSFALRQVDLGSTYAGQQIRIRFYYDFTGGFAYTGVDVNDGWLIDDIQIGSEFQKALYSIGNPTATEVLYLEVINRARADALVEAQRLAAITDSDVTSAYSFFGIDPADIITQFTWYVNNGCMDQIAQPLAFRAELIQAAQTHTLDMFDNEFQGHTSSSNPPAPFQPGDTFGDRLDRVGFSGAAGENVFVYANSVESGHAGFDVDWGNRTNTSSPCYNAAFVGQGMQNPAGHRTNIHKASFNEAGIGVINDTNGSVGPQLVTQVFGATAATYITGVIYDDNDSNGMYSAADDNNHEGRGDIRVDVYGGGFYTVSAASGAYAIPVDGDGTYEVTFSGALIEEFSTQVTVSGGQNIKLDHNPVDLSRYFHWAASYNLTEGPEGDDDMDGVTNIVESLVFGMNPTVADSSNLPQFVESPDGKKRLTLNKQTEADDLTVMVMLSTDLSTWTVAGAMPNTTVEIDTASQLVVAVDSNVSRIFAQFVVSFF